MKSEVAQQFTGLELELFGIWGIRPDGSCQCGSSSCSSPGKHPVSRWQDRANDAGSLATGGNVAVRCGGPHRILVVDIDGPEAQIAWDAFFEKRKEPQTRTAITSRGKHIYFTVPAKFDGLSNKVKLHGLPLDLRWEGGYVVAPPSVHASGHVYRWDNSHPIAELPEFIYKKFVAHAKKPTALDRGAEIGLGVIQGGDPMKRIRNAKPGERNNTLFVETCKIIRECKRRGEPVDDAKTRILNEALQNGSDAEEIMATIESAIRSTNEFDPNALDRDSGGKVKKTSANLIKIFSQRDELKSAIRYNILNGVIEATRLPWAPASPTAEWKDEDTVRLQVWLDNQYGVEFNRMDIDACLNSFAKDNGYHPVRVWLESVVWDQTERLQHWLPTYVGCDDNLYTQAVGFRWMISAIARVFQPGCQVDSMLIFEGLQEEGKSSAFRALGKEWFGELNNMDYKTGAEILRGKWIVEMAELNGMDRAGVSRTKAFITTRSDRYRAPWERRAQDHARCGVLCGTVNESEYLNDPTGARRFWPVLVGRIMLEELKRDCDQLWAEALYWYRKGEQWELTREEKIYAAEEQAQRRIMDPWEHAIATWISRQKGPLHTNEILAECLTKSDPSMMSRGDQVRVHVIMNTLKWVKKSTSKDGVKSNYWFPPGTPKTGSS